jgi:hypothetical protein
VWLTPVSASLLRVLTALTALRAVRLEAYAINDITCCARPPRRRAAPARAPRPGLAGRQRERASGPLSVRRLQGPDAAGTAAGCPSTAWYRFEGG